MRVTLRGGVPAMQRSLQLDFHRTCGWVGMNSALQCGWGWDEQCATVRLGLG